MGIEFEVSDIESVDEELKGSYVEKDGKYVLDPDKYYETKAAALIENNKRLKQEKLDLKRSLETAEKVKVTASTDIEKVAQEKDQEIAGLKNQLRESSIWSPVKDLAIKHGVLPDRLDAVMVYLRAKDRFDQDEESKLVFKDKFGDPTAIKPQRAFEVYLKEELPWAFAASEAKGSGAKGDTKGKTSGRIIPRERFDTMSAAERDNAIREGARIID
jgi:hypothetical protein